MFSVFVCPLLYMLEIRFHTLHVIPFLSSISRRQNSRNSKTQLSIATEFLSISVDHILPQKHVSIKATNACIILERQITALIENGG